MRQALNITGICGWGLPLPWFRKQIQMAFPDANIRVYYPQTPTDPTEAESLANSDNPDIYIGYSMGSLWLLQHQSLFPKYSKKVLLAPILGFCREAGLGGKVSNTQLKFMIREIQRADNILIPLGPFFDLCENSIPPEFLNDLPSREILLGGLLFLKENLVSSDSIKDFVAILGERDPLIDSAQLKKIVPHLNILANTGHALVPLLRYLSKSLMR